jgi:hypothetical protein
MLLHAALQRLRVAQNEHGQSCKDDAKQYQEQPQPQFSNSDSGSSTKNDTNAAR